MEVWAPARYVLALWAGGVDVRLTPLAGLGLGEQIGWLTRHARSCEDYHQYTGQRLGLAAAARWLGRDEALVYTGSVTAHHGQPVVDLTEDGWTDDGSLLGLDHYSVALANGVRLSNVHPDHLTRAPDTGDASAARMACAPSLAAAQPAARTTPTAARGRART